MRWSEISFNPSERVLRQFSGIWVVFFGVAALWQGYLQGRFVVGATLVGLGLVVGIAGLAFPRLVRPVYVAAMVAAFPVGWVVSTIVASAIFLLVFTPVALAFRLIGRDALRLRRQPELATYWVEKPLITDPGRYLHQS
jgi:hypothetical protein